MCSVAESQVFIWGATHVRCVCYVMLSSKMYNYMNITKILPPKTYNLQLSHWCVAILWHHHQQLTATCWWCGVPISTCAISERTKHPRNQHIWPLGHTILNNASLRIIASTASAVWPFAACRFDPSFPNPTQVLVICMFISYKMEEGVRG